jgi:hypothetical protein
MKSGHHEETFDIGKLLISEFSSDPRWQKRASGGTSVMMVGMARVTACKGKIGQFDQVLCDLLLDPLLPLYRLPTSFFLLFDFDKTLAMFHIRIDRRLICHFGLRFTVTSFQGLPICLNTVEKRLGGCPPSRMVLTVF